MEICRIFSLPVGVCVYVCVKLSHVS